MIGFLALAPAPILGADTLSGSDILIRFISILTTVIVVAIIFRAILSWFMPTGGTGLVRVLDDVTEPVLAPIRRALPPVGGIDFSPLLAIILVYLIGHLLVSIVADAA